MFKRAQRLWTISFGSQFLSYWLSKLIDMLLLLVADEDILLLDTCKFFSEIFSKSDNFFEILFKFLLNI